MPDHIKKILLDETEKAAEKMHVEFLRLRDEDVLTLRKRGIKVHEIKPQERKKWAQKLLPYLKKEISLMGDFGDRVMSIANEVNSRNAY